MTTKGLNAFIAGIVIIVMLVPTLSCNPSSDDSASGDDIKEVETAQLVDRISEAGSQEQREHAVSEVIKQGRSLGLLDENGNQTNPNVSDSAISLTPEDITSFAAFAELGHYSTIGSVVDYMAEIGVVLSSTGEVITFESLLPKLQQYVDWSFDNTDDPNGQLGILIASGHSLRTPTSAPIIKSSTQISPMAAILMLGDILIGVEEDTNETVGNWFAKIAYADDVQEAATRIQGLITNIEMFLKPASTTVSFLRKVGEKLGFTEESKEPPQQIKVPDMAKKIIGAFAVGSHFAVRMQIITTSASPGEMPVLKSLELDQVGTGKSVLLSLVLVPSGGNQNSPVEVLEDVSVVYTVRLLSPNETGVGTDLYPDANAILSPSGPLADTTAQGHIMDMAANDSDIGLFMVEATRLENREPRIAIMHASASILTGDLAAQYQKYVKQYAGAISALGLKPEELSEMFSVMKTAVKVSPWIAEVVLTGGRQVTIDPETLKGKPDYGYRFTASIGDLPKGSRWEWEAYQILEGQNPKPLDMSLNRSDIAYVSFPEPGQYWVTAVLWDGSSSDARVIDSATADVVIEQDKKDVPDVELSIETSNPPFESGCQVRFKAVPNVGNELLPEHIRWEWYWGDGEEDTGKGQPHTNRSGNEKYHNYRLHGPFTVLVKLYDDDTNTLLATATKAISIDNLNAIQRTHKVRALVWAFNFEEIVRLQNGEWVKTGSFDTYGSVGQTSGGQGKLEWKGAKGTEFSITYGGTVGAQTSKYTISGKISDDASVVETITATGDFIDTSTNWTRKEVLTLTNVPLVKYNCGDDVIYRVRISGADAVKEYLTHYEYESKSPEQVQKHTGFDWNYAGQETKLEIEFSALK